jgi:hypothetical protein
MESVFFPKLWFEGCEGEIQGDNFLKIDFEKHTFVFLSDEELGLDLQVDKVELMIYYLRPKT